jgi:hypothetical protein
MEAYFSEAVPSSGVSYDKLHHRFALTTPHPVFLFISLWCSTRKIEFAARNAISVSISGSLSQTQPLYQHRGQPLLDEVKALRNWLRERPADGSDFLFTSQMWALVRRVASLPLPSPPLPSEHAH